MRLHVGPGIAADGTEQPPSVRLVWEGHGEGVGKEPGGLLRFLGEGLSMYPQPVDTAAALASGSTTRPLLPQPWARALPSS